MNETIHPPRSKQRKLYSPYPTRANRVNQTKFLQDAKSFRNKIFGASAFPSIKILFKIKTRLIREHARSKRQKRKITSI